MNNNITPHDVQVIVKLTMAKKNTVTAETLQDAKERVKMAFRPSDEDPIVRFIGENGKMGLRHIFSEEVVEAPTQDFIEMPEAEVIAQDVSEADAVRKRRDHKEIDLFNLKQFKNYRSEYLQSDVKYFPPFDNYYIIRLREMESESKRMGVVNEKGELVIPVNYFSIGYVEWFDEKTHKIMYSADVLRMCKDVNNDLLYGFVRLDGTEVIPAKFPSGVAYDELEKLNLPMSEAPEWVYSSGNNSSLYYYYDKKAGLYGLQTIKGKKVTEGISTEEPKWEGYFNGKLIFEIRRKGEYGDDDIAGLVDETGKEILPCKYNKDYISVRVIEKLIYAGRKKKQGVFDMNGKPIVKCAYRDCRLEDGGIIAAYTSKDVTLFNRHGNIIIDKGQYDKVKTFSKDGLLYIRSVDCKWWYIDLWGNRKLNK